MSQNLRNAVKRQPFLVPWARAALETGRLARDLADHWVSGQDFEFKKGGSATVSICHPRWQGVRSAAEGQGGDLLCLPELSESKLRKALKVILENEYTHVVFNGFWLGYDELVRRLKAKQPSLKIFYVHHGSFAQVTETPEGADLLNTMVELQRDKKIEKIGFVKAGMDRAFRHFGIEAELVLNRVPLSLPSSLKTWPENAAAFIPSGRILRKNCHTQIVAALISGIFTDIYVLDDDLAYLRLGEKDRVRVQRLGNLSRPDALALMSTCTLSFNVTLSECAPMVVLESLAGGTPCISGENHGIFSGNDFLKSELLVNSEDDVYSIVETILKVRESYDDIVIAIHKFITKYDKSAERRFSEFVGYLDPAFGS